MVSYFILIFHKTFDSTTIFVLSQYGSYFNKLVIIIINFYKLYINITNLSGEVKGNFETTDYTDYTDFQK